MRRWPSTRAIRTPGERGWLAFGCALAAGVAALVAVVVVPKPYRATALVVVSPRSSKDTSFTGLPVLRAGTDPTAALQTAVAIMKQPSVPALTASRLGRKWSPQQVTSHVQVTPAPNTSLIDITAAARSPAAAIELGDAYASAGLALHERTVQSAVTLALQSVGSDLNASALARSAPTVAVENRVMALQAVRASGDPTLQLARGAVAAAPSGPLHNLAIVLLALGCGGVLGGSWGWLAGRRGHRLVAVA